MKKVVVIGGGTGTATVLSSLVGDEELSLTGIVSIADSGGSTGRLRDEFGFIPVGDVRQCLGALAVGENSNLVRELLLYHTSTPTYVKHLCITVFIDKELPIRT